MLKKYLGISRIRDETFSQTSFSKISACRFHFTSMFYLEQMTIFNKTNISVEKNNMNCMDLLESETQQKTSVPKFSPVDDG